LVLLRHIPFGFRFGRGGGTRTGRNCGVALLLPFAILPTWRGATLAAHGAFRVACFVVRFYPLFGFAVLIVLTGLFGSFGTGTVTVVVWLFLRLTRCILRATLPPRATPFTTTLHRCDNLLPGCCYCCHALLPHLCRFTYGAACLAAGQANAWHFPGGFRILPAFSPLLLHCQKRRTNGWTRDVRLRTADGDGARANGVRDRALPHNGLALTLYATLGGSVLPLACLFLAFAFWQPPPVWLPPPSLALQPAYLLPSAHCVISAIPACRAAYYR